MTSLKQILPAPSVTDEAAPDATAQSAARTHKRQTITIACISCRERKSRCNGARPVCSKCASKHTTCHYPVATGLNVNQLRSRNNNLIEKVSQHEHLLSILRKGNSEEIEQVIRCARCSSDVEGTLQLFSRLRKEDADNEIPHTPMFSASPDIDTSTSTAAEQGAWLRQSSYPLSAAVHYLQHQGTLQQPASFNREMLYNMNSDRYTDDFMDSSPTSRPTPSPNFSQSPGPWNGRGGISTPAYLRSIGVFQDGPSFSQEDLDNQRSFTESQASSLVSSPKTQRKARIDSLPQSPSSNNSHCLSSKTLPEYPHPRSVPVDTSLDEYTNIPSTSSLYEHHGPTSTYPTPNGGQASIWQTEVGHSVEGEERSPRLCVSPSFEDHALCRDSWYLDQKILANQYYQGVGLEQSGKGEFNAAR